MAEETPLIGASSVKEYATKTTPSDDMAVPSAWKDTIDGPPPTQQLHPQRLISSSTTFSPVVDSLQGSEGDISPPPSVSTDTFISMGRRDVVTPPVTHNTSVAGGSGSGATTPQLSPSLIASLRGTSSPSHSQVSVGSAVNPSLMSAVLSSSSHKHYDLTPVMRNTSDLYCDAKGVNTTVSGSETMTITPSSQEGYLHGEHLAFPSDLSRASLSSAPSMPPLQPNIHRRNSSGNMLSADSGASNDEDPSSFLQMDSIMPTGLYRNEIEIPNAPVQFPAERKYYSFTTREQYEEAYRYANDSDDDDLYIPSDSDDDNMVGKGLLPRGLTPYAPRSRPANFDIEQLPEEELKRIFITRADSNENRSQEQGGAAVPLDQRIPSLRMANHLLNESTTSISYTDNEDEDSVLRLAPRNDNDDAASLSSLGSNRMMDEEDDLLFSQLRRHRKRKQRKKEQAQEAALEWLQSTVESANIAEAASSKFLTTQPLYKTVALHRPVSSPAQVAPPPPQRNEH